MKKKLVRMVASSLEAVYKRNPVSKTMQANVVRLRYVISAVSFLCCMNSFAIPACPHPVSVLQPDGTEIMIRQVGDEWSRYTEDQDGRTIVKDKDTGYWVYVARDASGGLVTTSCKVGITDVSKMNIPRHLRSAN